MVFPLYEVVTTQSIQMNCFVFLVAILALIWLVSTISKEIYKAYKHHDIMARCKEVTNSVGKEVSSGKNKDKCEVHPSGPFNGYCVGVVLNVMRYTSDMTDITVSCGQKTFPAHKLVLYARSGYAKKVTDGLVKMRIYYNTPSYCCENDCASTVYACSECVKKHLVMNDIEPQSMEHLLNYMYSGSFHEILFYDNNANTFGRLLHAARLLEMSDAYACCWQLLLEFLTLETFPEVLDVVSKEGDLDMEDEVIRYLSRNFCELLKTKQFMRLKLYDFDKILRDPSLTVPDRKTAMNAVFRWLKYQSKENHKDYFINLMHAVNCINAPIGTPELTPGESESIEGLREIAIEQTERPPVAYLLAFGKRKELKLIAFDMYTRRFLFLYQLILEPEYIVLPKLVFHQNQKRTYITGGKADTSFLTSVFCFNAEMERITNSEPMLTSRAEHAVAHLDNNLYVAGGYNESGCIDSVESYDPRTRQWTNVASLTEMKCRMSMIGSQGCLYCVGGYDGNRALDTVEIYIPRLNQWTRIRSLNDARFYTCVGANNGYLCVIGGFSEDGMVDSVNSVLVYNKRENTWYKKDVEHPITSSLNHAVIVFSEIMYCISPVQLLLISCSIDQDGQCCVCCRYGSNEGDKKDLDKRAIKSEASVICCGY